MPIARSTGETLPDPTPRPVVNAIALSPREEWNHPDESRFASRYLVDHRLPAWAREARIVNLKRKELYARAFEGISARPPAFFEHRRLELLKQPRGAGRVRTEKLEWAERRAEEPSHLRDLREQLDGVFWAALHGSQTNRNYIRGESDVDMVVVLEGEEIPEGWTFPETFLRIATRECPTQHHGPILLARSHLRSWPRYTIPLEMLRGARVLKGPRAIEIQTIDDSFDAVEEFIRSVWFHRTLHEKQPRNAHETKLLSCMVALFPCVFWSAMRSPKLKPEAIREAVALAGFEPESLRRAHLLRERSDWSPERFTAEGQKAFADRLFDLLMRAWEGSEPQ